MSATKSAAPSRIDNAYSRFARHLPDHPYILGVPSFDLPRRRPHELALEESRWISDSPFAPDEAHLQYMTLVLRDTSDSCFELRTQVDEEREYRMKESQRNGVSVAETGTATPKLGPAKKKISLAAYKEKKGKPAGAEARSNTDARAGSPSLELDASNVSGARPNGHVKSKADHDPLLEDAKNTVIELEDALAEPSNPLKRKSLGPPETTSTSNEHPAKKVRASPPLALEQVKDRKHLHTLSAKTRTNHGLPPMLSPGDSPSPPAARSPLASSSENPHGLPPMRSPTPRSSVNPHGLPPMLSPTLPADLEKAWRDYRRDRARANSDLSSQSAVSDAKSSKYVTPSKPEKGSIRETASSFSQTSAHARHGSVESCTPLSKQIKAAATRKSPERGLLIKLKYSKRIRKQLISILSHEAKSKPTLGPAFKERTHKTNHGPSKAQHVSRHASPDKAAEDRTRQSSGTTVDSRKRPPDSALSVPGTKKAKPAALPNGLIDASRVKTHKDPPVTPIQDDFGPRKHEIMTPKNHSAPSASQPSRLSTPHDVTPLAPPRAHNSDRAQKLPNASHSSRPGGRTVQLSEYSKLLNKAGRDLKHGAQALSTARIDASSRQKQQAIMMLESNMSYMMAYSFQDELNRLRGLPESWETTWQTMFPFLDAVASYTKHFPDLEAVRCYLAYAATHRAIANMLAYMVSTVSSPPASTPSATGADQHLSPPDSVPPSAPATAAVVAPHPDPSLPSKIAGLYRKARIYITEATSKLGPDAIAKRYPKTWTAREQRLSHDANAPKKERESMLAFTATATAADQQPGGQVLRNGPFWLPVTEAVTPIQAVRFGVTICTEWAGLEGVKHEIGLAKAG